MTRSACSGNDAASVSTPCSRWAAAVTAAASRRRWGIVGGIEPGQSSRTARAAPSVRSLRAAPGA